MHTELLTKLQSDLLPLLEVFSDEYFLVGGTALALQIGHRKSVDFEDIDKQEKIDYIEADIPMDRIMEFLGNAAVEEF